MSAPTKASPRTTAKKAAAKKSAAKASPAKAAAKPPAKAASSARVRGRDTDSTRDAITRAAEAARERPGQRLLTQQAEEHPAPKVAAVDVVEEFAAGLSDKFLQCRVTVHQWQITDYRDLRGGGWSWRRYCPNCKLDQEQTFDKVGMLVEQSSPRYPKGYLATGMGRVDRFGKGRFRVEMKHRAKAMARKAKAGSK